MSFKVVINVRYDGFSISLEAAQFMATRGNVDAATEIREYEDDMAGKKESYRVTFYGFGPGCNGYRRDDPDLVAAVEALGESANGEHAALRTVEIPDDMKWMIQAYDGSESCIIGKGLCILHGER